MRHLLRHFVILSCAVAFSPAIAADLPGSQDPIGLKRYQGSEIVHTFSSNYVEYKLDRDGGWGKTDSVEGGLNRVVYVVPAGPTGLEILRNYEQTLAQSGFHQTFELKSDAVSTIASYFNEHFFFGPEKYDGSHTPSTYTWSEGADGPFYATFQGVKDGKNITIGLLVEQSGAMTWSEPQHKTSVPIAKDQVVVALDVVTGAAVANKMVLVKAEDMAAALGKAGKIDLYGIYFDTDKSDIKAESNDTLDEIAKLLKIDASLKLEVSGHTDNTGKHDHNMKLSQARAAAVVKALSTKYGIDGKRLVAKGYGETKPVAPNNTDEGKGKNRRVELRKI
jgi:outer membrane protein OmpA-like peptidoglycan-associated protein